MMFFKMLFLKFIFVVFLPISIESAENGPKKTSPKADMEELLNIAKRFNNHTDTRPFGESRTNMMTKHFIDPERTDEEKLIILKILAPAVDALKEKISSENTECAICHEKIEGQKDCAYIENFPCLHNFKMHRKCVDEWVRTRIVDPGFIARNEPVPCPLCKRGLKLSSLELNAVRRGRRSDFERRGENVNDIQSNGNSIFIPILNRRVSYANLMKCSGLLVVGFVFFMHRISFWMAEFDGNGDSRPIRQENKVALRRPEHAPMRKTEFSWYTAYSAFFIRLVSLLVTAPVSFLLKWVCSCEQLKQNLPWAPIAYMWLEALRPFVFTILPVTFFNFILKTRDGRPVEEGGSGDMRGTTILTFNQHATFFRSEFSEAPTEREMRNEADPVHEVTPNMYDPSNVFKHIRSIAVDMPGFFFDRYIEFSTVDYNRRHAILRDLPEPINIADPMTEQQYLIKLVHRGAFARIIRDFGGFVFVVFMYIYKNLREFLKWPITLNALFFSYLSTVLLFPQEHGLRSRELLSSFHLFHDPETTNYLSEDIHRFGEARSNVFYDYPGGSRFRAFHLRQRRTPMTSIFFANVFRVAHRAFHRKEMDNARMFYALISGSFLEMTLNGIEYVSSTNSYEILFRPSNNVTAILCHAVMAFVTYTVGTILITILFDDGSEEFQRIGRQGFANVQGLVNHLSWMLFSNLNPTDNVPLPQGIQLTDGRLFNLDGTPIRNALAEIQQREAAAETL